MKKLTLAIFAIPLFSVFSLRANACDVYGSYPAPVGHVIGSKVYGAYPAPVGHISGSDIFESPYPAPIGHLSGNKIYTNYPTPVGYILRSEIYDSRYPTPVGHGEGCTMPQLAASALLLSLIDTK